MPRVHVHYDLSPAGVAAMARQTGRRAWREQGAEADVAEAETAGLFFAPSAEGTLYTDVYGREFDEPQTVAQLLAFLRAHHLVAREGGRRWEPR